MRIMTIEALIFLPLLWMCMTSGVEKMNDLIRRSDAIEVVKKNHYNIGGCGATLKVMIEQIKAIPSADRPRGEWIDRGMRVPSSWVKKCSLCGYETDTWRWCNFCPNCGADMRKE